MLRGTVARRSALAVVVAVTATCLASAGAAHAATDVVVFGGVGTGLQVVGAPTPLVSGGIFATGVALTPGSGGRFTVGRTTWSGTTPAGSAWVSIAGSDCFDSRQLPVTGGYLDVHEAVYGTDGLLTTFSADAALACPGQARVAQVRLGSTRPVVAVTADAVQVGVFPGGSGAAAVTFTNVGDGTVHPGTATFAPAAVSPPSSTAVTADTCAGSTLSPGATCTVTVTLSHGSGRVLLPVPEADALAASPSGAIVSASVGALEYARPGGIATHRVWPGTDGVGLAWSAAPGSATEFYEVDRSTDGGTTWSRLTTPSSRVVGDPAAFADPGAPDGAVYRVVPGTRGGEDTTLAWISTPVPSSTWSAPAGGRTLTAVDGYGALVSTPQLLNRTQLFADVFGDGLPGLSVTADGLGWRTGSFTIGSSAITGASWLAPGIGIQSVAGTVTVTRAALRADGTPAELALAVDGTRDGGIPVHGLVLVGSVPTGLPGRVVPEPAAVTVWTPDGSDQTFPIVLRNVGGAVASTGTSTVAPVSAASTTWTSSGCINVQLAPGATCTGTVRVTPAGAQTLATATWTASGLPAAVVPLSGSPAPPTLSPTVTASGPGGIVRGTATVTLSATDPQAEPVALQCRVDTGPFRACTSPWVVTGLATGSHRLTVYGEDPEHNMSAWTSLTVVSDITAPIATLASPAAGTPVIFTSPVVRWSATDAPAGVASHDLRRRTATPKTTYSAFTAVLTSTTATTAAGAFADGLEQCWSVRSRDKVGNLSAWTAERCAVVPLDDRRMVASGPVTRLTTSSSTTAYAKTLSSLAGTRASLSYTGVQARQIGVVVRTCPTCGSLDVLIGGTRVAQISTRSTTTRSKMVLWAPRLATNRTGTVVLRPASGTVVVDGLVIRHN